MDPVTRIVEVFETTLHALQERSGLGDGSKQLANRLTTVHSLTSFSGNPLEWLHFKEASELSTQLGGYSERENIARLFEALKSEARSAVSALLGMCQDTGIIMKTLEFHFGNEKLVAANIVRELEALPDLNSGKINLTQFATKVRNEVAALCSLDVCTTWNWLAI